MHVPYIGITDFTHKNQVWEMLNVLDFNRAPGQERRLHVGVMMSRKTLRGEETKWSKAFPPKEKVASIFSYPEAMNCLHYADYDEVNLVENLSEAIKWGGEGTNALQLDMMWPNHDDVLEAIHRSGKKLEVILQVGEKALGKMGNEPEEVVAQIRLYCGTIHHVLLDKSGGKGLGMDAEGLRPFVRAVREALPQLGVTVAGGLGPKSLHLVEPLVEEFPDLNIDAQGKLRPTGDSLNEPIDWYMATGYLIKALRMFNKAKVAA